MYNGPTKLTPKIRAFIEAYLELWNTTEAARRANYKHPEKLGAKVLHYPVVEEAIKERLAQLGISSEEIIKRLADQARVRPAEFFNFVEDDVGDIKPDGLNWKTFRAKSHLVRKLTYSRQGQPMLEFYDAQKALELLGKASGALTERLDITSQGERIDLVIYMPDNGRARDDNNAANDNQD